MSAKACFLALGSLLIIGTALGCRPDSERLPATGPATQQTIQQTGSVKDTRSQISEFYREHKNDPDTTFEVNGLSASRVLVADPYGRFARVWYVFPVGTPFEKITESMLLLPDGHTAMTFLPDTSAIIKQRCTDTSWYNGSINPESYGYVNSPKQKLGEFEIQCSFAHRTDGYAFTIDYELQSPTAPAS